MDLSHLNLIIAALAAVAGIAQAIALVWTIRVQIRTARHQLRAYLAIDSAGFDSVEQHQNYFTGFVTIKIKNFGSTPARLVIIRMQYEIGPGRDETKRFDIDKNAHCTPVTSVPPNGEMNLNLPLSATPISHSQWRQYSAEKKQAYVWGKILYVDAFGKQQFTDFQMVCGFGNISALGPCVAGNNSS